MKVKELMEILRGIDPSTDVLCTVDSLDGSIKEGQILDIVSGGVVNAKKSRLKDGQPALEYTRSEGSESHLILEITSDF